ncbi:U2-associated protein SR140 [Cryptococcus wingfieldii CBS 7118]|uniref:U2-associated protein SR140 n=1 Tax=Cryptococcus wingfieldii CBS 7118 TaxID=1295528 RepID=A0A1E3ISF7_9TREE|nr:U2-associated protein SR140 [Cryptococcus wingfieldii CBS 7118]ODN91468.1 U2-associated protein SR140 [Cryptococcus wingfieldii CBS 7118]
MSGRRIDLAKFAGSDSEGEDSQPKRQLELTALKSKTFSHGITKKTKRDMEKEAEEKKRVEEEKAAALVMAEFEEEFNSGPSHPNTSMRGFGGGSNAAPMGPRKGFVKAGGAPMALQALQGNTGFQPPRGPAAMGFQQAPPPHVRPVAPSASNGPMRKKRAMDSFLQEIKNNQDAREQRLGNMAKKEGSSVSALAAWESETKNGVLDLQTTNLFVSNLPRQNMTEDTVGLYFAKIGPVGTVKIMWPRGEDNLSFQHRGLSGFVSYMSRSDAETAVRELEGAEFQGNKLRVGWSKAVPKPSKALYGVSGQPLRLVETDRKERSQSPPRKRRARSYSYSSSSSYSRSPSPRRDSDGETWLKTIPEEKAKFVKAVAERVREHGRGFEDVLREKEKDSEKFSFLFDDKLPEYHLYKSTLSSRYRIPNPPHTFIDEGYASMYSSDSAEDSEKERTSKGKLGRLAKRRFEAMLRVMSGKRGEIARAMEFALTHAEAADEIAETIVQSLIIPSTPVPRKLARLHLISDILHNSASPLPNVWRYRQAFEARLPPVWAHLKGVETSLEAYKGRISADVFGKSVGSVLDIWERWIVFNTETAELFRALLLGHSSLDSLTRTPQGMWVDKAVLEAQDEAKRQKAEEERRAREKKEEADQRFKSGGFKSSFKRVDPSSNAGESTSLENHPAAEQDLDGEAMEDLDGEEMGLDGEEMDLDGEPFVSEDLEGEVMEDLDGEAM